MILRTATQLPIFLSLHFPSWPKNPSNQKKTPRPQKKARVHKELEGFEIGVNPLGEITSNYSIEQINQFLGRHVRDKKLVDRAGQFGEKPGPGETEDEEFPMPKTATRARAEESEEDFMKRTSREAKRKKAAAEPESAAETRDDELRRKTTSSRARAYSVLVVPVRRPCSKVSTLMSLPSVYVSVRIRRLAS